MPNRIGTLSETSLHAALKAYLAQPGDLQETLVSGYHIDLLQGELLVEIQTGSFNKIRPKLQALLPDHPVRIVHTVPKQKWIVRRRPSGSLVSRRKSPRRGILLDIFTELVYLPTLINHPNFSLLALYTHEEEIWQDDGKGSWRRKGWSIADRTLLEVSGSELFRSPADYLKLLPASLPLPFTVRSLADTLKIRLYLAQKMAYTLYQAGLIERVGKQRRAYLYTPTSPGQYAP